MQLIDSKSLLAKLMATENLTIENRNVPTASFDVKNRILTVPTLDNNISSQLYDLFMGHEVGHALYTPIEGMYKAKEKKVNMSILNVVEDSRIERKIKYKYPGLKNSFIRAYNELVEKDFFGTNGVDLNSLNFIDRINLHCKGGARLGIRFDEEEHELLNEVESTETYDQVIEVSEKIVSFMKMKKEQNKDSFDDSDGMEDGDLMDDDSGYMLSDDFDLDRDPDDGMYDSPVHDDEDVQQRDSKNPSNSYEHNIDTNEDDSDIRSFTDDSYRNNESRLFANKSETYSYVNVPKFDVEKSIFDYKDLYALYKTEGVGINIEAYKKIRKDSNKVVSYLAKEFELRKNADQLKRSSIAKTGDLNLNKIFSYRFNEDIFKKVTVVPGGKSHGLVMFLDWSGSMVNHMANTIKQLFNLTLFCKKVNIPFEVYIFTESTKKEKECKIEPKIGDISLYSYGILNILSSRMSATEYTYACAALCRMSGVTGRVCYPWWMSLSGTPLSEAVISAMEIIPYFQKKHRLQIVNTVFLTDGEGHQLNCVYDSVTDSKGVNTIVPKDAFFQNSAQRCKYLVIRDPQTKHQEIVNCAESRSVGRSQTTALIRLLKLRTNSNVIGFYVVSQRDFRRAAEYLYPKGYNTEAEFLKFRKDKYTILTNTGYDEYYILRSNGLDIEEDTEFVVKENATTRGLVSAFTKYAGNRVNNRVVLNRFIGLIA